MRATIPAGCGEADYPDVCREFSPAPWLCGTCREEALELLARLERDTEPAGR